MRSEQINTGITNFLISRDKNWSRFQDFAIDILRAAEGVDYNSTVQYDDRGRDARTSLIAGRPIENAICCAVKDNDKRDPDSAIMRKAKDDLERLKETGIPKRITFCFNAPITEELRDRFLEFAKQQAPSAKLRMEGLEYFSKTASLETAIFLSHYRGDFLALQQSLLVGDAASDPASYGLRLAIVSQLGSDATDLRNTLIANMILLSLFEQKWHDRKSLCESISAALKLSRIVDESFVSPQLVQLEAMGQIASDGPRFMLSKLGMVLVDQLIEIGRNKILDQKSLFIDEFKQRLSSTLGRQFDLEALWTKLTTSLCRLMMDSGMRIARDILGATESSFDKHNTQVLLRDLALSALPFGVPVKRATEVAEAVFSVITQNTNFRQWLVGVASAFVSLCSLGLHPAAQKEMLARMENWVVVVDTHLVISFVCDSERDHDSVQRVLSAWARLNRGIATCDAVLEEAAYHAFAASREFDRLWENGELAGAEVNPSGVKNAFIRTFLQKSKGNVGHTRWRRFIFNYKGKDKFDGSKIGGVLAARGWEILRTTGIDDRLFDDLLKHGGSANHLESDGHSEPRMRPIWDVRLIFASIKASESISAKGGSVMVMTQSGSVFNILELAGSRADGVSIVNIPSLGYAMALTPGLSVSLPDVQDLLLEESLLKRAARGLERAARKVADREIREGLDLTEAPMLEDEFRGAILSAIKNSPF